MKNRSVVCYEICIVKNEVRLFYHGFYKATTRRPGIVCSPIFSLDDPELYTFLSSMLDKPIEPLIKIGISRLSGAVIKAQCCVDYDDSDKPSVITSIRPNTSEEIIRKPLLDIKTPHYWKPGYLDPRMAAQKPELTVEELFKQVMEEASNGDN